MRSMFASFVAVFAVVSVAKGGDRLDDLFASWEKAQTDFQSLVIELTQTTTDSITGAQESADGVLRLIRTGKGEFLGSYELTGQVKRGKEMQFSGLLAEGSVYLLDPDKKRAIRVRLAADKTQSFLSDRFNPLVVLLNRKLTDASWKLAVVGQDEWWTYMVMKRKAVRQSNWSCICCNCDQIRVTFAHKDVEAVPQDMPRRIEYCTRTGDSILVNIKAWRLNGPNPPKAEDFVKPENRPGWEVTEFPIEPPTK